MLSIGCWVREVELMSLVLFVEVYTEHEVYVVYTSFVRKNCSYDTNELSAPTTNTKRIQSADPDNTRPFDDAHPSGEARSTGTPTTRANESPIKARRVSWKIKSIKSMYVNEMCAYAEHFLFKA